VRASLLLCSAVYSTTSFFGFLLFDDHTLDDVLANFDSNLGIDPLRLALQRRRQSELRAPPHARLPIVFHVLRLNMDGLLFPSARGRCRVRTEGLVC
jgi:solute carrier family 38 (sodium-coupled neutral amino acid transporter), member 2